MDGDRFGRGKTTAPGGIASMEHPASMVSRESVPRDRGGAPEAGPSRALTPELIALARALGRDAARRHAGRRAHSIPEAALLSFLAAVLLAVALAFAAR
jgi:hypothetical protein